ncbi:MAG: FAD-binding oxidoreductase [Patulibacter sp.]|nr:FAD-binding oxidoreductase [Patulibacter sp.]
MSPRIGIIGAGAHGATAAFHLARRGVDTIVFERGAPASGPTGQASGVVRSYYTNPFLAELSSASTRVLARFAQEVGGGTSGYVETGALYLHGGDDIADVHATSSVLTEAGVAHEVLTPSAIAERFPDVATDGVAIAVWEDHAGFADPHATTLAFAGRAVDLGADLRLGTEVARITERLDDVEITTADGTVHRVDRLLVAAGPWTAPLLAQVGVHLPLLAERHVVAAFAQGEQTRERALDHVLIDVPGGYYSRPGATAGEFVAGPLAPTLPADPDRFSPALAPAERDWLAARAAARVPVRADAELVRGWASLYDVSPDWQPVIGQVSDRVYVDAGTSGHGFKLSPVLGDHVARLLLGDPDPRLHQFHPDRFAAGHAGLASGFGAARILG